MKKVITNPTLCYLETAMKHESKPLSAKVFRDLMASKFVHDVMKMIEEEPDMEKKKDLKMTLPAAIFMCCMPADGSRPTKNCNPVASGLCMHDFDGLEGDVRAIYNEKVAGREDEMGVMLAHVTPRGCGLRLVTRMRSGESIPECQHRMAAELGMMDVADLGVNDKVRLSFIPSDDYLIYLKDEMFTLPDIEVEEEEAAPASTSSVAVPASTPAPAKVEARAAIPAAVSSDDCFASKIPYQGVKFSAIIENLLERMATDGKPQVGERNNDLYALVRELRHITGYDFEFTRMLVTPYFSDLQDREIRQTINSAINSTGRTITPTMRGVLAQLKQEHVDEEPANKMEYPRMPQLPPLMDMVAKHYPANIRHLVPLAMLPILGTYTTHVKFRYLDGRLNTTSFMTSVVGKSGRGKAFANHLFEMLTKPFAIWDAEERKKDQDYQLKMDRRKQDEEYPEDPRAKVRLYADDITTNMILEYLDNLDGQHGLQFTEEVARLVKARKSHYADNDDIYCKSFDNGIAGKESKNRQTRNIRIPIHLNTLFCGTYNAMHEFYNNPEGGLNNRIIYALLPDKRHKGVPHYDDLTPEEADYLHTMQMMLWHAGTKEEEDGVASTNDQHVHQGEKEMKFPFLDTTFNQWIAKCDREDEENPDETWRDLANRSAVIGYRAGVMAWLLWGRPKETDTKTIGKIKRFAKWVAEVTRISIYLFCGDEYDNLNAKENEIPKTRCSKNNKLLSVLGNEFTVKEVVEIRRQNGESTNVAMIMKRWRDDGLVIKVGPDTYQKVKRIA